MQVKHAFAAIPLRNPGGTNMAEVSGSWSAVRECQRHIQVRQRRRGRVRRRLACSTQAHADAAVLARVTAG